MALVYASISTCVTHLFAGSTSEPSLLTTAVPLLVLAALIAATKAVLSTSFALNVIVLVATAEFVYPDLIPIAFTVMVLLSVVPAVTLNDVVYFVELDVGVVPSNV